MCLRRASVSTALVGCLALTACSATDLPPAEFHERLATAPPDGQVRVVIANARIRSAAVAIDPQDLPAPVRTTIAAVLPGGDIEFVAREWGPRGDGYRIEKRYGQMQQLEFRSALIAVEGQVMERSHSVPIGKVPKQVLAAALDSGPIIDDVQIVSGSQVEEFWMVTVRDRAGRRHIVRIDLGGRVLDRLRRTPARLEAPG